MARDKTQRRCSTCEVVKPISEFYPRRSRGLVEWQHQCKVCGKARAQSPEYREWQRAHYRANRDVKRDAVHRTKYRLSQEQLDALRDFHLGLCAICGNAEYGKHQNGRVNDLAIDHDHDTGQVRGLLCNSCNRGLAGFKDNIGLLSKAAEYLAAPPADDLFHKVASKEGTS